MYTLKKQYRDLETQVFRTLREQVEITPTKTIKVNLYDYVKIALINDRLIFIDDKGYEYDLYSEASLEDLIDILSELESED